MHKDLNNFVLASILTVDDFVQFKAMMVKRNMDLTQEVLASTFIPPRRTMHPAIALYDGPRLTWTPYTWRKGSRGHFFQGGFSRSRALLGSMFGEDRNARESSLNEPKNASESWAFDHRFSSSPHAYCPSPGASFFSSHV